MPVESLARLTDDQLVALFDHEREGDGWPKLKFDGPQEPTPREAHLLRCYVNGVTEKADVERLWQADQAKRAPAKRTRKVRK